MPILSRLRPDPTHGQPEIARNSSLVDQQGIATNEKVVIEPDQSKNISSVPEEDSDDEDIVHKDAQRGVQKMEALAQVWPKWALYFIYAW